MSAVQHMIKQTSVDSSLSLFNKLEFGNEELRRAQTVSTIQVPATMPSQAQRLAHSLTKDTLQELFTVVKGREKGEGCITPRIFAKILEESNHIENEKSLRLFEKIDWSSLSKVSWTEFCTYMQMEYKFKDQYDVTRMKMEIYHPARIGILPHREPAACIIAQSNGTWITTSQEGMHCLWTPRGKLVRNKVCVSKLRSKRLEKLWVTDVVLLPEHRKLAIATGERDIRFFDMAFAPICRISGLDDIPMCMFYRYFKEEKGIMLFGDQSGAVSVISFQNLQLSLRSWKKHPKHEDLFPNVLIDQAILNKEITFVRWQVHKDWVNMVRYYMETDVIISSSLDPHSSLVIGHRRGSTRIAKFLRDGDSAYKPQKKGHSAHTRVRHPNDQIVYSLLHGINTFDYSMDLRMVATGGADRVIRLWNCFLSKKPLTQLWGHFERIRSLQLCKRSKRLFSVSADLWVKVWDVMEFTCVLTVPRHVHGVYGELKSVAYNSSTMCLALLADTMLGILIVKRPEERSISKTHEHPVTCIVYNSDHNQIISACEGSNIKTWNIDTGCMEGEFIEAHGTTPVACMTLDSTNKRLITAGVDGTGKMWNHNTGLCVRALQPAAKDIPTSTITYIDMRNVKYVMTGGWTHRLNFYIDDTPETIPFVMPLLSHWHDDRVRGHSEDIQTSDFSTREKLATGSYDGTIKIWQVETKIRVSNLTLEPPEGWSEAKLQADSGVSVVYFLKLRSRLRRGGNLVSGGPYGHLAIWDAHFASSSTMPMARFLVNPENTSEDDVVSVGDIDSDPDNTILVSGDSEGRITVWDIDNYAICEPEPNPPRRITMWEAHLRSITGVKVVKDDMVVSSSRDGTVRLWTKEGHFVGTFGQWSLWNRNDEATFQHPAVPRDIADFYTVSEEVVEETESDIETYRSPTRVSSKVLRAQAARRAACYEAGLAYFGRKKAVISKRRRHLNDESHKVMSVANTPCPYRCMRCHSLDNPPLMEAMDRQLRQRQEDRSRKSFFLTDLPIIPIPSSMSLD